jgi:uncharacterized protein (DUF488 family)
MATLYTIGHGARSESGFGSLLRDAVVSVLVDVRAFPASRRHPQFSRARLAAALESERIRYDWQGEALGGFRKGGGHSAHAALRHPMFRAYAAHMESAAFARAAEKLAETGRHERLCILCAERDPVHCHRSLIADWLVTRGHRVIHLLDEQEQREHVLNPLVTVDEGQLLYDGAQKKLL